MHRAGPCVYMRCKLRPGLRLPWRILTRRLRSALCAYISNLHVGRVNPKDFKFGIDVEQKRYDLPQFLAQKLLGATDVPQVLNEVEPPYYAYQRTEAALQTYLALAAQDHSVPLPEVPKTVAPGDAYAGLTGWRSACICWATCRRARS